MADKISYPMLPVGHWWGLRRKFKQSIPGTVTASYVAATLDMKESSARANILPYLQQLGIIDDEGKTLDRARQWRDDAKYPDVCKEIREDIYPDELFQTAPDPANDREPARRWFGMTTGSGEAAVNRMTTMYAVLMQADPKQDTAKTTKKNTKKTSTKRETRNTKVAKKTSRQTKPAGTADEGKGSGPDTDLPGVYINLQVHVSSDSTPDQIDQIFASMAKHIYRKE